MSKKIEISRVGKLTFKAVVPGHTFLASEPEHVGGPDAAPTPGQYLVASIGLCKSMYAELFCARHEIPMDGFRISLEYDQDPRTTQVQSLSIHVRYPTMLPEGQREKFIAFLEKCAVQKAITEGFPITLTHGIE
ncbi:MAG: OsmC family protein [bacterium]|jgi:putative redox protein